MNLDKEIHAAAMRLRQIGRVRVSQMFGTLLTSDGRYKATIDLIERSLFLRAETNALTKLLLERLGITPAELQTAILGEFRMLADEMAKAFPEMEFDSVSYTVKDFAAWERRVKAERWPK